MRYLKRVGSLMSSAILAFSSIMTLGFTGIAHAAVNTCTWTGTTNDNFNTATNWSGCNSTVPQNGDNLVFDVSADSHGRAVSYKWTLTNDISNLQTGSITFTGTSSESDDYAYDITGNGLTLDGDVTNNSDGYQQLAVDLTLGTDVAFVSGSHNSGVDVGGATNTLDTAGHALSFTGAPVCGYFLESKLTGSGALTTNLTSTGLSLATAADNYTGAVNVTSGMLGLANPGALGSTSGVTVASGGTLAVALDANQTYSFPLSLSGAGFLDDGYQRSTLYVTNSIGFCGGGPAGGTYTATFSGPVTLASDVTFSGAYNAKITGTYTPNGHKFTVQPGSTGSLTTPQGTTAAPVQTNTYSDDQPTKDVSVGNNQTAIIDGTRQDASAYSGGVIKGIGTVKSLYVGEGGTVAPGHSPGKLTVLQTLDLAGGSTYQAELKDAAAGDFDQIVVGSASDTTGNDVTLGDSTGSPKLDVVLYSGAKIKAGDTFKIIDNLSKTAVSGTFQDLPEGTTFKVGSGTMKISYVGGDGNDVVLTAMSDISAPDTGFAVVAAHPIVTLSVAIVAAVTLAGLGRKLAPARARTSRR